MGTLTRRRRLRCAWLGRPSGGARPGGSLLPSAVPLGLTLAAPALAIALGLHTPAATAQQWFIEPSASVSLFYDDNVRLSVDDPISSFGTRALVDVDLGRRTEVSEIAVATQVRADQYTDATDLNSVDGTLALETARRLERHRLALDLGLDYDSTLTSEEATSGLVQVNKRRRRLFVGPAWSYAITPRASLDLTASYADVAYDDVDVIPLFDYTFATVSLGTSYALSERAQLFGRVLYDRYEAEQIATQSDTVGFLVGGSYRWSPTLSLTGLVGARRADTEAPTFRGIESSESTGPLAQLRLQKDFKVGKLVFAVNRTLAPSSTGTLLDTTSGSLRLEHPLTPRWGVLFDLNAYRNRNPDGETNLNDRDFVSLSPRLRHKLSDWWQVDLAYRYRHQEREIFADAAQSNAVFLTLRYTWPREPLARWSLLD